MGDLASKIGYSFDEALALTSGTFTRLPKIAAPFTTIVGRAQCVDPSNDHQPRFGISRVMTQQIMEVQGESGPNGERVWKPINDQMDQVRAYGNWTSLQDAQGNYISDASGVANISFLEITFYGTALNILASLDGNAGRSLKSAIDGGSLGSELTSQAGSSNVLVGRNYATNQILTVASGLSAGVHTVRLMNNAVRIFGFEVLNTASTLQLVPGSSYVGGRKLTKSALSTDPYNSNFESGSLGTRGGHVVVYHKADGTIKKAVQPVDVTALYLTSATHTNESVIRSFSFREFGAGRADDFSSVLNSARAFTLDDGTTTLVAGASISDSLIFGAMYLTSVSDFFTLTFVGTGLDVLRADSNTGTTDTVAITVDGTSQGNMSTTGSTAFRTEKICSGLPYGTHTVKFTRSVAAGVVVGISRFIVYGASKPAVPAGAVELADYYVMANYVNNGGAGSSNSILSTGTLHKSALRELIYTGTWTAQLNTGFESGGAATSTVNTSAFQYTFLGTGIEIWATYGSSATATVSVNGSAPAGGNVTVNGGTYSSPTWTLNGATGSTFALSGLAFGLYTITVTVASNSGGFILGQLAVITPIHSPKSNLPGDLQNTLLVGSNALGDSRLLPEQTVKPLSNWAQAVGVSSNPTTTSTTGAPMPDMICIIKTGGNPIEVSYSASVNNNTAGNATSVQVYVDGVSVGTDKRAVPAAANYPALTSDSIIIPVAAGVHIVQLFWFVTATIGQCDTTRRNLKVREL